MKIALLSAIQPTDVWNIPIAYRNWFCKYGHDVKIYTTYVNNKFTDVGLVQLINDAESQVYRPDIVFHLDFGFMLSPLLEKKSLPTAIWIVESGDDPQNFHLNSRKIVGKGFDIIHSPDIRAVRDYLQLGENAVWSPHFADPDQFNDIDQQPIYDAVTTRDVREPFFAELKNRLGCRFEGRVEYLEGKNHSRHLMKGRMVIQNSKYKEITRRIFEGMLANRLVITDRPDPKTRMDLLFTENEDIVYFDSIDECVAKINYFTENEEERARIATNGYNKVLNQHTVSCRVEKMMKLL